jgi:hypothetical protein
VIAWWRSAAPVLGRWPRRLAALACLLLSAGAALSAPHSSGSAAARRGFRSAAPPDTVAVPVTIAPGGADFVGRGDRIGLVPGADSTALDIASPGVVADRLRVLRAPMQRDDGTAVVLLAVPRAQVGRLARHLDRPLVALIDPP